MLVKTIGAGVGAGLDAIQSGKLQQRLDGAILGPPDDEMDDGNAPPQPLTPPQIPRDHGD